MNIRTLFLILSYLFSFTCLYGQFFKKIGMKDGLSSLSVLSIYQDPIGRMWFGTTEGLNVYNGNEISRITKYTSCVDGKEEKNLLGNVHDITGDGKSKIFVLYNDVLLEYDLLEESFNEISPQNVRAIDFYNDRLFYFVNDSLMSYIPESSNSFFDKKYDIPYVTCLESTSDILYVGSRNGLFEVKDGISKCILPDTEIFKLYKSSLGELWVATRIDGLFRIKPDGEIIKEPISVNRVVSNQIREFVEDNRKRIWFGTFDGLQMYDPEKDEYKVFLAGDKAGMLEHESVFSLYKDVQGTIWVGTYYGGINYFNTEYDMFTYYDSNYNKDGESLSFPIVGQIVEDKDHNLWIATDGGGVNLYDKTTSLFTYFDTSQPNSILHDNVKSIAYDKDRDCLYIGTYTGGLSRFDRRTNTFYNYLEHRGDDKMPSDRIHCCKYHKGVLYITATNGFWTLDVSKNRFSIVDYHSNIISIEIDEKDNVWLASKDNIYLYNIHTSEFIRLYGLEKKLPRNIRITKVLPVSSGDIYISTLGAGIFSYDLESKELKQYLHEEYGLLSNFCYNMAETESGDVLITNDKGISVFSSRDNSLKTVEFQPEKGMISAVTDVCGICVASDSIIYIGGIDGMVSYKGMKDSFKDLKYNFYFESLFVNNSMIKPSSDNTILKKSLIYENEINLKYNQNNISLAFASSNYVGITRAKTYQYMLEGFDKDWITTDRTKISYTNIEPGKYRLLVREKGNKIGGIGNKEIALAINVGYPWFANIYAYIIYFIIVVSVFYGYWRASLLRHKLAMSLENEKREKQQMEEVNKIKLRFFTNISHEFRTPLTLIMGQVETLLQNENLSLSVQRKLQRVYKNSLNMRNLITELLDFRKQEQGYMHLKVEKYDLIAFVQDIYDSFREYAEKRGIEYHFYHAEQSIEAWFDSSQLQKAIFNLLSNAFKYTPTNGKISIKISTLRDMLEIEVKDSGCGISPEAIEKIFDRFYQADNVSDASLTGTGIGLALTKGIIEMHKGRIEVASEIDKGSTFRILLKKGNSHFTAEELESKVKKPVVNAAMMPSSIETYDENIESKSDTDSVDEDSIKPVMLIVEDDEDILMMLEDIFMSVYKVYRANNGSEGFELAKQLHPDIIISDVMMPVMTGKEMCYKIKNSLELSHIPVVLLTAQTSEEHTVEGYMFGADDYITKPFNVKVLMSRCNSLVKNRQLVMEKLRNTQTEDKKLTMATNVADQKLVEQAIDIIKKNFENPDFDMNMLAAELNMGRSKLYSRIKEITGFTPNEFTLNLKLKEGLRLLKDSPELNVSEISYKLGFTSPRYFSKCFKAFYGVPPQSYRKGGDNL